MNKRFLPIFLIGFASAQQSDEPEILTRKLWDTTLQQKREAQPVAAKVKGTLVGVTVWGMRQSRPEDAREVRAMVHESSGSIEMTPERLSTSAPLKEGQRVRLGVESTESGYLYIIDRDLYADGTKSPAYLIFPTLRTRGGNARVKAGMLVEIPGPEDQPAYFTIKRSRPDQVSETLTILLSPQPIPGLVATRTRIPITDAQVAVWEKQWQSKTLKLDAKGGEGKTYTVAEKQAAAGVKPLTASALVPQTLYQVENKPAVPVLLQVPLRIAK